MKVPYHLESQYAYCYILLQVYKMMEQSIKSSFTLYKKMCYTIKFQTTNFFHNLLFQLTYISYNSLLQLLSAIKLQLFVHCLSFQYERNIQIL